MKLISRFPEEQIQAFKYNQGTSKGNLSRLSFSIKKKQDLRDEVKKYEDILKRMKDYDDNLAKEKVALATQEEEKRKLEVIYSLKLLVC